MEQKYNGQYIECHNAYLEYIFQWAWESMLDSGGDGWSFILSDNYQETYDLFLNWVNKNAKFNLGEWKTERFDDAIMFYYGQEGVTFSKDKYCPYDITFKIHPSCKLGFQIESNNDQPK